MERQPAHLLPPCDPGRDDIQRCCQPADHRRAVVSGAAFRKMECQTWLTGESHCEIIQPALAAPASGCMGGGPDRNRTDVRGFAVLCIATLPPGLGGMADDRVLFPVKGPGAGGRCISAATRMGQGNGGQAAEGRGGARLSVVSRHSIGAAARGSDRPLEGTAERRWISWHCGSAWWNPSCAPIG